MSSTNRGAIRNVNDYYITPEWCAEAAVAKLFELESHLPKAKPLFVLDPCCGGDPTNEPPYPGVLAKWGVSSFTVDIRDDSKADYIFDFLGKDWPDDISQTKFDLVISNLPFNLAMEFIKESLDRTVEGGFVAFLLPVGFMATDGRKEFMQQHPPKYQFVSSKRPGFIPKNMRAYFQKEGKKLNSDSREYAHFVWQKGHYPTFTKTYLL